MDKIDELLTRGVANVIPNKESLEKLLRSGKKLNIYFGVDPTAPHLHLGNATHLRRLQALSDLGHNITFLIGDFTALIGDTSDKDSERPVLTLEQIDTNWQTYKSQAEKLVDFSKITIRRNSEWLSKLSFENTIKLIHEFSLNDFISRELIKRRLGSENSTINLAETLYPVMQGYDSWFLDTDLQLGGTDQTFNMQAGRVLQKNRRNKESYILTGEFLEGTDGRKMSKSWSNAIWLDDAPNEIYGKIMSLKDGLIERYFLLATNLSSDQIPTSGHPMELKKQLAHQIVLELHDAKSADAAKAHFESTFQKGLIPSTLPEFTVTSTNIVDVLVEAGLASSKSDAKRLIDQNAVEVDEKKIHDTLYVIHDTHVLKVGRRFAKVSKQI
ncbi:MAG: tyrosine--tRNA ligase [Patescibacteria group bacterium]